MIYQLKVTSEASKNFLRVYEIKASQTLYELHEHIQNDLGYAPDQMIEFRTLNANGQPENEYGLFDMGDGSIDNISLQDLREQDENVMFYVFDMHNNRSLRIEIVQEEEGSSRKVYPLTTEDKGVAPDQFDPNKKEEKELPVSRKPAPCDDGEDDLDNDDIDEEEENDEENEIDDDDEILDDNYGGMFGEKEEKE